MTLFFLLLLFFRASSSSSCSAPAPVCIRGSPGMPGPGKATLRKFAATDPASQSLGACCAAGRSLAGCVAVQLVTKKPGTHAECWLMGQPHASSTMRFNCTSSQLPRAPSPVPRRAGPASLPLDGSARGIVNLGGGPAARPGDPAFERFQQIDLQWTDVEPHAPGVYNWTAVEALARSINASGRMAVFKVNSNYKPAWLYELVPWSNVTWTAEELDGRTVMYWHPAYVAALSRRIAAEAEWLATSPYGAAFVYARQSWAAIGEEGIGIPGPGRKTRPEVAALRDGRNWVVPSGCVPRSACDPPPSYDAGGAAGASSLDGPTNKAYLSAIGKAWLDAFNRSGVRAIRGAGARANAASAPSTTDRPSSWGGVLLLRADAYDSRFANLTAAMMGEAGLGWFQTGAAMEETQCFNQTFRYAPFRRDCLAEHGVVCFAESCGLGSFAGPQGPKKTPALQALNFSRIQGAYWELLSNMDSGIHVTGLHSSAFLNPWMSRPDFAAMYAWADDYMGLHASPTLAPGGWVAFRPTDPEGKTPPTLIGDYSFLMQRKAGMKDDTSVGLTKCGTSWEPGNQSSPFGAWCRSLPAGASMFLVLDQALAASLVQQRRGTGQRETVTTTTATPTAAATGKVGVRLVYSRLTRGAAAGAAGVVGDVVSVGDAATAAEAAAATAGPRLQVRFDDGTSEGAVAIDTAAVAIDTAEDETHTAADTGKAPLQSSWQDVHANVSTAVFARGGTNGADVWVTNLGSDAAMIHMVEVSRK